MKIAIIEDERRSYEYLTSLVRKSIHEAEIYPQIESVASGVRFFNSAQEIDLVFMDIQLADGLSLEILAQCEINTPIIFTTAFDQYAIEAFKHNSIDYLLKPIQFDQVDEAINKFRSRSKEEVILRLQDLMHSYSKKKTKSRFLVKSGKGYRFIPSDQIAFMYSEDGLTFINTMEGQRHLYNKGIEQLSEEIDPGRFFRINRGQIVCIDAINEIHPHLNQRLKLKLNVGGDQDFIVSRHRAQDFKLWLDA